MNETVALAAVRKSVHVKAPIARAFEVFTSGLTRWWPTTHGVGGKPIESLSWEAGQCAQLIECDSFVQLTRHQQNISARSQVREEATVLNDVADAMPKFGDVR